MRQDVHASIMIHMLSMPRKHNVRVIMRHRYDRISECSFAYSRSVYIRVANAANVNTGISHILMSGYLMAKNEQI